MVGAWLGRLPALGAFDWWPRYEAAVRRMHEADEAGIIAGGRAATMRPEAVAAQVAELARSRAHYAALFDSAAHAEAAARGERRWPYRALQAALFITLYGEEPLLAMPARLLRALAELDEALAAWRHAHALMVQRMLGAKPGTGGSSGFAYLRATVDRHKVFADLQAVPTYLIASNLLPPLPQDVQDSLQFWAEGAGAMAGGAAAVAAAGSLPPPAAAPTPAPAPAVPMRCPAGHG